MPGPHDMMTSCMLMSPAGSSIRFMFYIIIDANETLTPHSIEDSRTENTYILFTVIYDPFTLQVVYQYDD